MYHPSSKKKIVAAKLVCAFVFAHAKCWFSHDAAHIFGNNHSKHDKQPKNNSFFILSRIVRKPDFCICENKGADQLRSYCEADQHLCFATLIVQFLFF